MSIADAPLEVGPPTHLDLPETDGKPVENAFEHPQSALLSDVLLPVLNRLHPNDNYFVGADTGIYWRHTKPDPLTGCKSPDWYYVPNVPRTLDGILRRSYVLWVEGVRPLIVIEYVSGTGADERDETPFTGKFWVYERGICAINYALWDQPQNRLEVYELVRGRYQLRTPDAHGRFWIPEMEVSLGLWDGTYQGYTVTWVRAWDRSGQLLPTAEERGDEALRRADNEHKRAEAEKQRAETEKQRAEKLAARLRELGIDPDSV
jgi:Uma2 family endonuclease